MAETSATRTRLLAFVRSASINLAFTSDDHGDYVGVDAEAYKDLIRWINRLVDFEVAHHESNVPAS